MVNILGIAHPIDSLQISNMLGNIILEVGMNNESRVRMTDSQYAALQSAADRVGLKLATFLRWAALNYASLEMGIRPEDFEDG